MRIIGHGIDAVAVARIARLIDEHGPRFLDRCFTPAEQAYADDSRRRVEHLAARFAAKEAVLKALGTGLSGGIAWTEIGVVRNASGGPRVELTGAAARSAAHVREWFLSISHTGGLAFASAIAVGE